MSLKVHDRSPKQESNARDQEPSSETVAEDDALQTKSHGVEDENYVTWSGANKRRVVLNTLQNPCSQHICAETTKPGKRGLLETIDGGPPEMTNMLRSITS